MITESDFCFVPGNSTRRHLSHKGTKEHKPGIHEYIRVVRTMFDATLEEHGMLNGIQTLAPVQEVVVSEETDSEHGSGSESESESDDEGAVTTRGMKRGIATKALLTRDPNQLRPFEVIAVDNRPMPPLRDKVGDPKPYHGNVRNDGPDFNYSSNVSELNTVRSMVFW